MVPAAVQALETVGAGIENAGNSCYMAACLQAVLRVPYITQTVLAEQGPQDEFKSLLRHNLSKTFGIENEKAALTRKDTNELKNTFEWLGWDKKNEEADPVTFLEFLLPLLDLAPFAMTKKDISKPTSPPSTHLLIHGINYAAGDMSMQDFIRCYKLFSTCIPELLPVVIDGRTSASGEKRLTRIIPSELLELAVADKPEMKVLYQLSSIIVYTGRKNSGGHYIAFVLKDGNKWIEYNDSVVTPHPENHRLNELLQSHSYIHFYSRLS